MTFLYDKLIRPAMFSLDAETAHEIGINALRVGLSTGAAQAAASNKYSSEPFEMADRFGLHFSNPIGMAAGFDKNARVVNQLAALGFGHVEVGTVTLRPQPGNEKPRLFRLPADKALINRLGFNNDGAEVVARRLAAIERKCVIGVNIGKNKDVPNEEAVENYLACFDLIYSAADYITVNISSPNTPNLRELQKGESLEELIGALQTRNIQLANGQKPKPLLVKIAPDLTEVEIEAITDVCVRQKIAGIIATNTTISRDGLATKDPESFGPGGLSGRPLLKRSNEVISTIFRYSNGKLPVVGVGGIFTAEDAFQKIAAGACLIQSYTGFVYSGPAFASSVNRGLLRILKDRGFASLDEAIGTGIGKRSAV
jgi:dihydroorotate dehydrogenase